MARDRVVRVRVAAVGVIGLCPRVAPAVLGRLLDPAELLDVREPAAELLADQFDVLSGSQRREALVTLTLAAHRLDADLTEEKLGHSRCWARAEAAEVGQPQRSSLTFGWTELV